MLTAKDIMTTECITLTPDTEIAVAAKTLLDNKINGAPVIDDGAVVGVLCQADLVAQQKKITLPSFFTYWTESSRCRLMTNWSVK